MAVQVIRKDWFAVVEGAEATAFVELRDALDALTPGYDPRAVVLPLTGTGGGAAFAEPELRWFERFPIPSVAAIEGEIAGHVLDLALACDIRVAGEDARLRFAGTGSARLATLLGRPGPGSGAQLPGVLDAEEAFAAGLVSELAPAGGARAAAERVAAVIASRGPIATRVGKEAIWRGLPQPLEQALRFETDLTLLLQTTKDRAEGVKAFLEKRPPTFAGR